MMKSQRLFEKIRETGFVVDDMGDVKVDPVNVARPADGSMCLVRAKAIGDACKNVAEIVAENTMKGNFQLTLGGDHSIAIGSIAGKLMAQPELGVIWVDAHADINTVKTSDSQNIHGMAVAFLLGLADTNVPGFEWLGDVPNLLKERLVYIGLRDVDAGESVLIKKHGIKAYTMHEIDRYGIGQVMDMAIDHVTNRVDRPLHISYDIDSVDPEFAQATGTKVYGGLTYREAFYVAESVANTGLLTSLDMVEVNPYLATDEELFTVNLANNIVTAALGKKIM
jgi:arginase